MKKKKAVRYLVVIFSLLAISITAPFLISAVSDYIVSRISGQGQEDTESETDGDVSDETVEETVTEIGIEPESGKGTETVQAGNAGNSNGGSLKPGVGHKTSEEPDADVSYSGYYDAPVYASQEEEDAANAQAYREMETALKTQEEAVKEYRDGFNPTYEELSSGMMSRFILGREQDFYDSLANFCFGHYNTTLQISRIRFDAVLEDTDERMLVILEFFSRDDRKGLAYIPDLALCSYNKETKAYTFFRGSGR